MTIFGLQIVGNLQINLITKGTKTMKKTTLSKIITLALSLIVLAGAVFAIGVVADDSDTTASLRVARFNVDHGANLVLQVAVDSQNTNGVSLEIYSADGSTLLHTLKDSVETDIGGKTYLVFSTPGLAPKDMYTEFRFKAVSADTESEIKKYSVLEYFYEKIYFDTNTTTTEKTFLEYARGYAEYAYRIFNKVEPQEYVYAYYDMEDAKTSLSEYLVTLGTAVTPSSDAEIEAWDVINEDGETIATVSAGESFTATVAGAYKFVPKRSKVLMTFDGLTASSSFGSSKYTNTKGLVLADTDGGKKGYIYNQNKSNTDCFFAPGVVAATTDGSKYTFEMDLQIDTLTGNLAFYDYLSSEEIGSAGTNYAFILTIATDGTVTFQNFTQKQVVEGKTITAGSELYHIEITGDTAIGGTVTLTVNGEVWATVATEKAMVGDSFQILFPKSTSSANTKIYIDNCGVNYYD